MDGWGLPGDAITRENGKARSHGLLIRFPLRGSDRIRGTAAANGKNLRISDRGPTCRSGACESSSLAQQYTSRFSGPSRFSGSSRLNSSSRSTWRFFFTAASRARASRRLRSFSGSSPFAAEPLAALFSSPWCPAREWDRGVPASLL